MVTRRGLFWLTAVVLLGALLRVTAFTAERRFHADEALFATMARQAAVNGDWAFAGAASLDKPPLALLLQAASMAFTAAAPNPAGVLDFSARQGELAARLPALLAGVLQIALVAAIARRLGASGLVAGWAALLMALSPLGVAFSGSAFTDMPMLTLALLALWMALGGRWGWAGLALGLAAAAKPQALFFLPLVVVLGGLMTRPSGRALARFALAGAAVALAVVLLEVARAPVTPWWSLAAANNLPALGPEGRLDAMVRYLPALFGAPTAVFVVIIPLTLALNVLRGPYNRALRIDLLLTAYVLAVLAVHVLFGLNWYDRYWLVLLPALAMLAARAAVWLYFLVGRALSRGEVQLAAAALMLAMLVSAVEAAHFRVGYSSQNSSFPDTSGIDEVGAWLNGQHVAAVVYDHWLNWQLGYYLGAWTDKRRAYYPDPQALVVDALALQECELRYLPAPADVDTRPWVQALEAAGFSVEVALRPAQWIVYAINPQGAIARCAEASSQG